MAFDPRVLANHALDVGDKLGYPITNLSINKILYFSHGWHLAHWSSPLVDAKFEAWRYGPVIPLIYQQFKRFGERPIKGRATRIDLITGADVVVDPQLPTDTSDFFRSMVQFYGTKSGIVLSMMSHEPDAPWATTRADSSRPGMLISDESIRRYFAANQVKENGRNHGN